MIFPFYIRFIFCFLAFITSELAGAVNCIHDEKTFRCVQFVRNYDADTITFNIPKTHPLLGKEANIRVFGVDTPEIRTKNVCEKQLAKEGKKIVAAILKKAGYKPR